MKKKVVIMGAAGRDFHCFLTYFRPEPSFEVVAFTAEQIPGIAKRSFPKELAGSRYGRDIPIVPERQLAELVRRQAVDLVCLAYSDLSHQEVMEKGSQALASGASFLLLGPRDTYVEAKKPVVAVTAVRTGCGKSQTARVIGEILRRHGRRAVAIRHSMPYGDLADEACQRFACEKDFARHRTTIEEEEEYQPWLDHGFVVYAGFDYRRIVRRAEKDGDILVFDGGNNDVSMIRPDLQVTVVDPHRAGHETTYYPGFVNLLLADVVVVNKVDSAEKAVVDRLLRSVRKHNPGAKIVRARSELRVDHPELITRRCCVVIGDGPTLTHGGMPFGAGTLAVERHGGWMVDPRDFLVGSLARTFRQHPHLKLEIPAMGYSRRQIRELERSIARVPCDVVVDGTPADLSRLLDIERPVVRVDYELDRRAVRALERILQDRGFLG